MAHCSSPGCSRKHEAPSRYEADRSTGSCGSPGCPGRAACAARRASEGSRATQDGPRPTGANAAPRPGTATRPPETRQGNAYSRVLLEYRRADKVLVAIMYPEVIKFGGLKLTVYEPAVWDSLTDDEKGHLDPHFYDDDKGPAARFRPDETGLAMAEEMLFLDRNSDELKPFRALLAVAYKGPVPASKLARKIRTGRGGPDDR